MLKTIILEAFNLIHNNHGTAYFVGGSVRDFLIDLKSKSNHNRNLGTIKIKLNKNLKNNKLNSHDHINYNNKLQTNHDSKNKYFEQHVSCLNEKDKNANCDLYANHKLDAFLQYLACGDKDIDIATNLHPDTINKIFSNANYMAKQTLVTNIVVKNRIKLEITTLRKDINPNGRWTQTEFAKTIQEDSKRRDFTINAIYFEPNFDNNTLTLHDFYDGIDDIKNGIVKFIGNAEDRIKEDYLRMLRFFRFSCRFAKAFDSNGLNACIALQNNYKNACVANQSGTVLLAKERIKDELFKILSHKNYKMFLDAVQNNNLADGFFNISNESFCVKKLRLYNILKIFNSSYKIHPLWIFLSIAGDDQEIILLSRKEEFLVNIVKNGSQIQNIFNDSFKYFTMSMRVREFFSSYNKNQNDTITQEDFVGMLILYFSQNNIGDYEQNILNILKILPQILSPILPPIL